MHHLVEESGNLAFCIQLRLNRRAAARFPPLIQDRRQKSASPGPSSRFGNPGNALCLPGGRTFVLELQLVAPKRGRTADLLPPLSLLRLQTVDVVFVLHTYLIGFRGVSSEPGKRSFQEETPSPMLPLAYFAENTVRLWLIL